MNNPYCKYWFNRDAPGMLLRWIYPEGSSESEQLEYLIQGKVYSDLFVSVPDRVSAIKYYLEFYNKSCKTTDELLNLAYIFLNERVSSEFIKFYANKISKNPVEYVKELLKFAREIKE